MRCLAWATGAIIGFLAGAAAIEAVTRRTMAGVATFSDLSIDTTGAGIPPPAHPQAVRLPA